MANQTTFTQIQAYTNIVWEGALDYLRTRFVAQNEVSVFGNLRGMESRSVTEYNETPVKDNVAELDDLSTARQPLTRDIVTSLSPKEIGKQFLLTYRRIDTDTENVLADASMDIGYTMGKKIERDILANITNFSGGIVGSNSTDATLDLFFKARVLLEARDVPASNGYVAVMSPFQYFQIYDALTKLSSPAPLDVRNTAQNSYYVGRVADMRFVVSNLIPTVSPTNEVQTITFSGSPTGGTFTVSFYGRTTPALAHNISVANLKTALENLPTIGKDNITITVSGPVWTITFVGALGGKNLPLLVVDDSNLSGGSSPSMAVAESTKGGSAGVAGVFTQDAIAFDVRRPLLIEPDHKPSLRSWELNASAIYATGTWRSAHGIQVITKNTAPD